jgi:dipeptidase E
VILLASLELPALPGALDLSRVAFVPTAANGLDDRAEIAAALRDPLVAAGAELADLDLDEVDELAPDALGDVTCVACSGGDPFHLLGAMRRSGFDRAVARAGGRIHYLGMSAGAAVAGPSLAPLVGVSPFTPADGLDGLRLAHVVPLVHDDRPGRRALHERAHRETGRDHRLLTLTDAEVAVVSGDMWEVVDVRSGVTSRPVRAGDASGIAETYVEAGRAAWTFVEPDRFDTLAPPIEAWEQRIDALADPDELLVATDDHGIAGFAWVRMAQDADLPPGTGELGACYVRPRWWGTGIGRRLLDRVLDRLRADGHTQVVLYTEERNERPRRVYERAGWVADGHARERDFLGTPIREVRYRREL